MENPLRNLSELQYKGSYAPDGKKEKETFTLHAMMEDDMMVFLKKNGYWGALKDGYLKCPCGETITEENLAGIKPKDGKIVFFHSVICIT